MLDQHLFANTVVSHHHIIQHFRSKHKRRATVSETFTSDIRMCELACKVSYTIRFKPGTGESRGNREDVKLSRASPCMVFAHVHFTSCPKMSSCDGSTHLGLRLGTRGSSAGEDTSRQANEGNIATGRIITLGSSTGHSWVFGWGR